MDEKLEGPETDLLNRSFYRRSPAIYFRQRLNTLLVAAAGVGSLRAELRAGITAQTFTLSIEDSEHIESELAEDELQAYITAESEVLRHHTIESLLRLYIAEAHRSPAPWLDVSGQGSREFWSDLDQLLPSEGDPSSVSSTICVALTGRTGHTPDMTIDADEFDRRVGLIAQWMAFFGRSLRDHNELYNAAKHGFAVLADDRSFALGIGTEPPRVMHSGPSLEYLTRTPWNAAGVRDWCVNTTWTTPTFTWFSSGIAADFLDATWRVGRERLLGIPNDHVFAPPFAPIDMQRDTGVGGISTARRVVLREHRRPK